MRSSWDRRAIPQDDVDFWSSMRHVAGGARATVRRAGPAEPVLEPTTGVCTTGCDEPDVSCVTCSSLERGDDPVSRSNDERAPLNEVTSAGGSCSRGRGTVAGTGMENHRR
jgi:hypothetical protein